MRGDDFSRWKVFLKSTKRLIFKKLVQYLNALGHLQRIGSQATRPLAMPEHVLFQHMLKQKYQATLPAQVGKFPFSKLEQSITTPGCF